MPLLDMQHLSVRYEPKRSQALTAVQDVTFSIGDGEFVGLIGESGSGKTTLGMALLRLLERPGRISDGKILFNGNDITHLSQDELRPTRWRDVSTVFQSSMNSLNPVTRVEAQFRDVIEYHTKLRGEAVTRRVRELFEMVIIDPKFANAYPHELSGGMKQRVNLAMALAIEPRFVLLDEPTTGLDVVVQHEILENVRRLQREQGFAVLFISHDIGTVLNLSDRILVMYAGRIVEEQGADSILRDPLHPYSKGLLGSYGDPRAETVQITYVPGRPPDLSQRPVGCNFAPRCPERIERCVTDDPPLFQIGSARAACHVAALQRLGGDGAEEAGSPIRTFAGPKFVKTSEESKAALRGEVLLSVENVSKVFERRRGLKVHRVQAVQDVSFELRRGEVAALVGQSGSGKSTLASMITGVDTPTAGRILFHGDGGAQEVAAFRGKNLRDYRSHVQMVFQDPYSSLNPAKTLGYTLSRPLANYKGIKGDAARAKVLELLETVALNPPERYINRFAYELSGGQRQRVVIARALAVEPELIVADEPISSLDVSIRAEILELLNKLVHDSNVGILYITHDLLSARMLSDEVIVLNQGQVVESGPSLEVIRNPKDAYTRRLLEAIPSPDTRSARTK
ncbi:peptide/nickel transport system ATP-binding protein [Actinopolymorpha cephalotaxi]|uniref:Peptide/nickel transport system ATP-binding protein n=1 Tax=Actinopolymorpha cephalotaxi TaxID=504797 RepID=A0A1I2PB85_9ACTN|nr:ABC transporter ATP-binding protein [Actinopolymorpha cephalotaxi]NYH83676.1 peptide/nickel transport system ATP-binding protein [Actinopolymorpha cephalotaxi]SFG13402.1 peptide/nickel transport system ATP-binding protein [Actinopolymorpha cephalotaxi]